MPLFVTYHSQLLYCLLHYLVKDPALVAKVFRYIFRHWPVQVAKKQVLLLVCVGEMINTLDLQSLSAGAPYLLAHLAKTLQSPHFQVGITEWSTVNVCVCRHLDTCVYLTGWRRWLTNASRCSRATS